MSRATSRSAASHPSLKTHQAGPAEGQKREHDLGPRRIDGGHVRVIDEWPPRGAQLFERRRRGRMRVGVHAIGLNPPVPDVPVDVLGKSRRRREDPGPERDPGRPDVPAVRSRTVRRGSGGRRAEVGRERHGPQRNRRPRGTGSTPGHSPERRCLDGHQEPDHPPISDSTGDSPAPDVNQSRLGQRVDPPADVNAGPRRRVVAAWARGARRPARRRALPFLP